MAYTYILAVDDDEKLLKSLRLNLAGEGWHILTARNGAEALQIVEQENPDLVLLDIMMPEIDGFEVCRRLRQWSHVSIIGLSARGDTADKVKCLDLGADDYITKPFGMDELIARIKAVLRRNKLDDLGPVRASFEDGDLKIDFLTRKVTVAGDEIRLTPTEYKLLRELVLNPGQALAYRYLLGRIWGPEYKTEREYLHVFIGHLRSKIEPDPKNPVYILSVPGVGYRFRGQTGPELADANSSD
jgi:two-component system KDP operon response regulator KdpE